MKELLSVFGLIMLAGCASVELSSNGSLPNGDRLLVIQNNGYELLRTIPLGSGDLSWNARKQCVNAEPALFQNNSDTQHLYAMAIKIAERENCDLVDVTFIDNYEALNPNNIYGLVQANDTAISAILRPRAKK